MHRSLAKVGFSLCGAFTVLNLGLLILNWRTPDPSGAAGGSIEVTMALAYAAIAGSGTAMVVRRPYNRVGWVFLLSGLVLAASAFASEYASYGVLTEPGSLPAVKLVTWVGAWGWWAGAGFGLTFGLMLYPDGDLPSPRWRGVAAAALANVAVLALLHALTPGPFDGEYASVVNPFGVGSVGVLRPLRDAAWLLLTANAVLAVAALVVRARKASAESRRQLQWLVVPALTAVVAAPLWGVTSWGDRSPSSGIQVMVVLAVVGTPIAVALALRRAATLARSVDLLVLAREEERRRIRRDLHDGLGPTLAGVALELDVVATLMRSDPETAQRLLHGAAERVKDGIGEIRRVIDDLRPPVLEQHGLLFAIREGTSYLNHRGDDVSLELTLESTGNLNGLPPATELTAFRIVMEAVTNASRHAKASRCLVRLAVGAALEVLVEDDGRGLAPDHVAGVGLASMCERAAELGGTCAVKPRAGGGTSIRALLPIGGS